MASDTVLYYWGDGEYIAGVPARDLTQADIDALDPVQLRDATNAEIVRFTADDTEKRYRLYADHAMPGNTAKALLPKAVVTERADAARERAAEKSANAEKD